MNVERGAAIRHGNVDPLAVILLLKNLETRHAMQIWLAIVGGGALSLLGPLLVELFYLIFSLSLISD